MYYRQTTKARADDAARLLRHAADSIIAMREAHAMQACANTAAAADRYCADMARNAPMLARRVYEYNVISWAYA